MVLLVRRVRCRQLAQHLRVEGIEFVWPVESDQENMPARLRRNPLIPHRCFHWLS